MLILLFQQLFKNDPIQEKRKKKSLSDFIWIVAGQEIIEVG